MRAVERMRRIYATGAWGGGSGDGSDPGYCERYVSWLSGFVVGEGIRSVIDLGCGDGRIAAAVEWGTCRYVGVDCAIPGAVGADLTNPEEVRGVWTDPDLVIVKDVLQHLSDPEVVSLMDTLVELPWRYVVIVNDWRYVRSPDRANRPRDVSNRYSWAALDCRKPPLAAYGPEIQFHYPARTRRKQVSLIRR